MVRGRSVVEPVLAKGLKAAVFGGILCYPRVGSGTELGDWCVQGGKRFCSSRRPALPGPGPLCPGSFGLVFNVLINVVVQRDVCLKTGVKRPVCVWGLANPLPATGKGAATGWAGVGLLSKNGTFSSWPCR